MIFGQLLLIAGVQLELRRLMAQKQGHERDHGEREGALRENQRLGDLDE
jgi:hypothetical protein